MSRVTCLPGDSMYGKAMTSVAPAVTHSAKPAAIDGSASSMCAWRTRTRRADHLLQQVGDAGQHVVRFGADGAVIDQENGTHAGKYTRDQVVADARGGPDHEAYERISRTPRSASSTLPNGADTCTPCTKRASTRSSISRAIAIPSATACSFDLSFARRIRAITASGTVDARHFVREELGVPHRDERPDSRDDRNVTCSPMRAKNVSSWLGVEHRLRDRVLRARLHLPLEAAELVLGIDRHRIDADADREARRLRRSSCRPDRARDSGCSRDSSGRSRRRRTPPSRRDTGPSSADRR